MLLSALSSPCLLNNLFNTATVLSDTPHLAAMHFCGVGTSPEFFSSSRKTLALFIV